MATDTPSAQLASFSALRTRHLVLLRQNREHTANAESIESFLQESQGAGAWIDEEEEREAAQQIIDYWTTQLLGTGRPPLNVVLAPFNAELAPRLSENLCPYRGLDAFREAHRDLFFGRSRLLPELGSILVAQRVLFVLGPSGSGKSSLVMGGLLPALRGGLVADSANWRYLQPLVPGPTPLLQLARLSLGEERSVDEDRLRTEAALLRSSPAHLVKRMAGPLPLLLLIDQFEEIFTLCNEEDRQAFAACIAALVQAADVRAHVILTMRSDFESRLTRLDSLWPLVERAQFRVPPMSASELREAIEFPAQRVGLRLEAGVVEALVGEILGEPAGLPLLQFTLLKLWELRARNRITLAAYREIGGGRLALERAADKLYNSLIPELQVAAKRILLALVQPDEGLEVTSNRIPLSQLYKIGEVRERIDEVLGRLVTARLVRRTEGTTEDDTLLEVAHEALVRNWRQLVAWLDVERNALRRRPELTRAAKRWDDLGRAAGALWRPPLLDLSLLDTSLNPVERQFLLASKQALEDEQRNEERARQRELEHARAQAEIERQRAEVERRSARQLRWLSITLGSALVLFVLVIGAVAALRYERENAIKADRVAAQAQQRQKEAVQAQEKAEAQQREAEKQREAASKKGEQARNLATLLASQDIMGALTRIAGDPQLMKQERETFSLLCREVLRHPNQDRAREFCLKQEPPVMVSLKPGTFQMGGIVEGYVDRSPLHRVTITRRYAISLTEINLWLYRRVMGSDPTLLKSETDTSCATGGNGDLVPARCVSFIEAARFTNKLSERAGLPACYKIVADELRWHGGLDCRGYRLPTDAEWEYAARAGETTLYAGSDDAGAVAWYLGNAKQLKPVALKQPNAFGLFDMSGNVREWVWDNFEKLPTTDQIDPIGPMIESSPRKRVMRSGSVQTPMKKLPLAYRGNADPTYVDYQNGIRIVRTMPIEDEPDNF